MSTSGRLFDVVGAAGGGVAFAPTMAAVAVAIWCEDRGPVLFRQERVGQDRRPFTILKFRSMRDGRVTRIGRLLRGDMTTPEYDFRWRSRPGLTGLAQLAGADSPAVALALDREYLERRRLRLDCQLIALSFAVNAFGKARVRAYLGVRLGSDRGR